MASMSDQYPETITIEIDRDRLRNYLRAKGLFSWALVLSLFGGLFGLSGVANALDHGLSSRAEGALILFKSVGTGVGISLLVALFCYLIFTHRIATRQARTLQVSVEGAFLRVRQHTAVLSDRKLHFRSIVDYATTQDFLMRQFGIYALQMSTTAGGQNTNLVIHGIKDCLRVRDDLADIDRLRETQDR